jgi:anti-sigma B factor antagonist
MTVGYRTVVNVEGDVDIATVRELDNVLDGHVAAAVWELWVDLSRVTFLDSHGLRALLRTHSALEEQGRRLTVICPTGSVRRILAVSGADAILDVFADRTSAQRAH